MPTTEIIPAAQAQVQRVMQTRAPDVYVFRPTSLADVEKLAHTMLRGGFCPSSFRGNIAAVMCSLMAGAEVGFTPFQSVQNIFIIKEKPSMYTQAMVAIVEASGLVADGPVVEFQGDGKSLTCTAKIKRVGKNQWAEVSYSLEEATQAGLNGEGWRKYPKRMLRHRAIGWLLQDTFPDVLRGMRTVEEMNDVINVTPPQDETVPPPVVAPAQLPAANPAPDAQAADAAEPASLGHVLALIDGCQTAEDLAAVANLAGSLEEPDADQARGAYRKRRKEIDAQATKPGLDGLSARLGKS